MTAREIKKTFGRFFAIFAIIAIGVGFFSGLRITTPVMVRSMDRYYRDAQLYDYRLVSTLGWQEKEVEAFRKKKGVKAAEGAWQYDVLIENKEGVAAVYRIHSMTDQVNGLTLREGRLPEDTDECLMDASNRMGFEIGDTLTFAGDNDPDTLEALARSTYKIVGFTDAALYVNFERGTTSIGNGSVSGYIYLPRAAFTKDYYTEIYVKLAGDEEAFSDAYSERLDENRGDWEAEAEEQADVRYDDLYQEASEEIADAKAEFEEKKADGEAELADARQELDDADKELTDARQELDDGAEELADAEKKLADAKAELDSGRAELAASGAQLDQAASQLGQSKTQLDSAKAELDSGKTKLDQTAAQIKEGETELKKAEKQLTEAEAELDKNGAALDAAKAELDQNAAVLAATKAELDATKAQLDEAEAALASGEAELNDRAAQIDAAVAAGIMSEEEAAAARREIEDGRAELQVKRAAYEQGRAQYEAGFSQYEAGKAQYDAGLAQYEAGKAQYDAGKAQYEAGKKEFDAKKKTFESGKAQYEAGLKNYEAGKAKYDAGKAQYDAGLAAYQQGKAKYEAGQAQVAGGQAAYDQGLREYETGKAEYEDGLKEYEDGLKEYEDGLKEYEDGVAEFNEKIADAGEKIADAERELDDLEEPDAWLLERNTNIAYVCFENDSQIVRRVAGVFPLFFILVAALVCITTMSRMVEEQRGQIGVLKGLGYSDGSIMSGFMVYAGSAALLGCVTGYAGGIFLFPAVIWYAYQTMYIPIELRFLFDPVLFAGSLAASLLCSLGTAYLSCRGALRESAASLLRPKAPKAGKRVFLERIPAIWNRMSFMRKISVRNIFRYKKRLVMMVLGIGGCMALLLTGFGLKNSISGFAETQFDEIQVADAEVVFRGGKGGTAPADITEAAGELGAKTCLLRRDSWNLIRGKIVKSVDLVAPYGGDLEPFFRVRDLKGSRLEVPAKGEALISISLADRYDIAAGEEITLRSEDMKEMRLTVAGVFQNHVYNYVIVSPETIREAVGEADVNSLYINFPEETDVYEGQAAIATCENVSSVTVLKDFRNRLINLIQAMNYVVLLVIFSAGALAFVVVYNLTNINIIERIREIATIKVLGFFPRETAAYIFRENVILTAMGGAAGIGLGILLHRFVMSKIAFDLCYFPVRISPLSYVWSVLLTFVFTAFVNLVMRYRLDRINMAESLKAVE